MSSQPCSEFELMLEQEPDGPLPGAAMLHMDLCSSCRLLWNDLETIRALGAELDADEPVPAHLWPLLRARLEAEGLLRETVTTNPLARWFASPPRLALAGATVAVLVVAVLLANFHGGESYVANIASSRQFHASLPAPTPALANGIGKTLDGDLQRVLESLPEGNPSLASSLRDNLGIVDNLIAVCEKSVRELPDDPIARGYLYGAYQQKAVLLATATDRSALEGQ
jgi:hypothetical protein